MAKKYKAPRGWTSGAGEPRWGMASDETHERRNRWADRVAQTEPKPLQTCKACGGFATRTCNHSK